MKNFSFLFFISIAFITGGCNEDDSPDLAGNFLQYGELRHPLRLGFMFDVVQTNHNPNYNVVELTILDDGYTYDEDVNTFYYDDNVNISLELDIFYPVGTVAPANNIYPVQVYSSGNSPNAAFSQARLANVKNEAIFDNEILSGKSIGGEITFKRNDLENISLTGDIEFEVYRPSGNSLEIDTVTISVNYNGQIDLLEY